MGKARRKAELRGEGERMDNEKLGEDVLITVVLSKKPESAHKDQQHSHRAQMRITFPSTQRPRACVVVLVGGQSLTSLADIFTYSLRDAGLV